LAVIGLKIVTWNGVEVGLSDCSFSALTNKATCPAVARFLLGTAGQAGRMLNMLLDPLLDPLMESISLLMRLMDVQLDCQPRDLKGREPPF
jgi:hypothetical protein